jgi:uncharacterized protein (TIGR00369 family)
MTFETRTLQQWLEHEQQVRKVMDAGRGPGVASLHEVNGLTGLEILQGIRDGMLPYAPVSKTLDFLLLEVDKGYALFQGTPQFDHLNPLGTVHGGWIATLLDSALGCAVHTIVPKGRSFTTTQLSINYVKAVLPKVSRVRAEARVVHSGRQVATSEAKIYGPDSTLFAHASTTCILFDVVKSSG